MCIIFLIIYFLNCDFFLKIKQKTESKKGKKKYFMAKENFFGPLYYVNLIFIKKSFKHIQVNLKMGPIDPAEATQTHTHRFGYNYSIGCRIGQDSIEYY